jgi:hypothetical protein
MLIFDDENEPITPKKHRRLLSLITVIVTIPDDPKPRRPKCAPIKRFLRPGLKGIFPFFLVGRSDDGVGFLGRETRVLGEELG